MLANFPAFSAIIICFFIQFEIWQTQPISVKHWHKIRIQNLVWLYFWHWLCFIGFKINPIWPMIYAKMAIQNKTLYKKDILWNMYGNIGVWYICSRIVWPRKLLPKGTHTKGAVFQGDFGPRMLIPLISLLISFFWLIFWH